MSAGETTPGAARPLRALVSGVVLSQPMGGVRRHNAELLPRVARLLAAEGGALGVLAGPAGIPFPLPAEVELLPSSVPPGPPLRRAMGEARALERALAEARDRGRPFDLVHTAHLPAPRRLSVPMTLTIHDLRSLDFPHTPLARRLLAGGVVGRALRRARVVITVSETMQRRLCQGWGLAPERVRVVPNAADHFEPLPRHRDPRAPLLHVGHLEPRKNIELLLAALAVDPDLPALELAGRERGDEGQRLRARASALGVARRVSFLGPFDDAELPLLYARAGCVVLPSHLEGFGIAALEAQRAHAPLCVSRATVFAEIAGEDVPSFAPDDPGACARAIRMALETDEAVLAERARRAARYGWDASARAWLDAWLAATPTRT